MARTRERHPRNVAIIGGTGYTGGELLRLLLAHPGIRLAAVSSRRQEGRPVADVIPWLGGLTELVFTSAEAIAGDSSIDLVFSALGHMESVATVGRLLESGKRVIDLSADFRFRDPEIYDLWYKQPHPRPDLLGTAVYGLPEINRQLIAKAALVANPGCYATTAILGLLPLAARRLLDSGTVVIDAKSGVSGAGRTPREDTVFPECHEGFRPYAIARHRHQPEMEAVLGGAQGKVPSILFVPHLLPANRGILATIYVPTALPVEELRQAYEDFYWREPFVKLNPVGRVPGIQDVRGSNYCRIGLESTPRGDMVIVVSTLDNLVKGASGQAVQNMNIMLDLPEEMGLAQLTLAP